MANIAQDQAGTIINAVAGVGGSAIAVAPKVTSYFYETPEWLGLVAILGVGVLILSFINAVITFRNNLK